MFDCLCNSYVAADAVWQVDPGSAFGDLVDLGSEDRLSPPVPLLCFDSICVLSTLSPSAPCCLKGAERKICILC